MKRIDIAVVDDHDLFREGIMLVLGQIPEFHIMFDASDGESFLEKLSTHCPDVVLMDINMPRMDGATATAQALSLHPNLKIIALTMFSDHLHYSQMIRAGVKGFILKKGNKQELQQAITEVSRGGVYFSQEILQKVALHVFGKDREPQLTARELDVLGLVCSGLTSHEIADRLFISFKTVEGHRTNIFQKTGVRNTTELVLWAIRNDYLTIK
jgi:NarL family two-component system response regulator LiaR